MSNIHNLEVRCTKCDKLLAKNDGKGFEVKCHRCGTLETLDVVLEHMLEKVIIISLEGKILFMNKSFEKMTGFSLHESIGKKPSELWGGNMHKSYYTKWWKHIRSKKESVLIKVTNKKKSGELYELELIVSPVLNIKREILFHIGVAM